MATKPFFVNVRIGTVADTAIISVSGPLVLEHLVTFQEVWNRHPESFLILDVSGLSYIDSAAIGFLVNEYISRDKNGKKLALAGVHGLAQRILNVTRVGTVLKLFDTVEDAERSFHLIRSATA